MVSKRNRESLDQPPPEDEEDNNSNSDDDEEKDIPKPKSRRAPRSKKCPPTPNKAKKASKQPPTPKTSSKSSVPEGTEKAVCTRRIIIGSTAQWNGAQSKEYSTHKWTVYVRPGLGEIPPNLDYISKVIFKLHDSFEVPVRTVERPPFEVTESGWGEFTVHLDIHFVDPSVEPFSTVHTIRLRPPRTTTTHVSVIPSVQTQLAKENEHMAYTLEPVVAELHEELLFSKPTATMLQALGKPLVSTSSHVHPLFVEKEVESLRSLEATLAAAGQESDVLVKMIEKAEVELKELLGSTGELIGVLRRKIENVI
eukprot:PhF_6_TR18643/c0_g1_i1/m.27250/K11341/YEATS4, GAS41, YAF9; YEATS domain-containing protein 4